MSLSVVVSRYDTQRAFSRLTQPVDPEDLRHRSRQLLWGQYNVEVDGGYKIEHQCQGRVTWLARWRLRVASWLGINRIQTRSSRVCLVIISLDYSASGSMEICLTMFCHVRPSRIEEARLTAVSKLSLKLKGSSHAHPTTRFRFRLFEFVGLDVI
jgi:hypothetical protein